jgi:membrane protease YdiL (CAAX protease family)
MALVWVGMGGWEVPDEHGSLALVLGMVSILVPAGVFLVAARLAGWSIADYFAFGQIRRRDVVLGIGILLAIDAVVWVVSRLTGIDDGMAATLEMYRGARAAGTLVLLWIAVMVVAPVAEELVFRGFLFRGLSVSRLGVAGTVVITAAVWAVLHVQYTWLGIASVFAYGLVFGWLRWRGSISVPMLLHFINNIVATMIAAAMA